MIVAVSPSMTPFGLYDSLKGLAFTGEDFSIPGGGITKGRQGLGGRVGILTASQGLPKT